MLPTVKKTIETIKKISKPIGFNLFMGIQDESKKHYHLHISPKYRKNYGIIWSKEKDKLLPGEHREKAYQVSVERLGANQEGVFFENEGATAKLFSKEESRCQAHTVIKPKKSIPNDI